MSSGGIFLSLATNNVVEFNIVIELLSEVIDVSFFQLVVNLD